MNLDNFYSKLLIDSVAKSLIYTPTVKYRKQRVPVYFKIKVPVVSRHSCDDYWLDDSSFLISFKEVRLFKIGSKIESVPYYPRKRPKGKKIEFRRYSPLEEAKNAAK